VEWDDEGLADEPASPLLPPDDRLWRHPSEVAGAPAPLPTSVRGSPGASGAPRVLTAVALTSCLSVLLTVGIVAVVRPFRDNAPPVEPAAVPDGPDVADLTAKLRPAIARVIAVAAGGDRSWGSGVLIRSDGLVLTAHHVVAGAASIRVVLDDGRNLVARFVGGDTDTDIALLDLEGDGYPTAPLASSRSSMQVGEPAFTIGATSGNAGPLVTASMVSATNQEAGADGRKFVDVIRTDAAVEEGCAGGAVVDGEGRVIGIAVSNTATAGGAIGFATPIDVARSVADQLLATGKVTRAWLGIDGETTEDGAVVRAVKPGSPAEVAGLAAGDVLVAIDDDEVASMADVVIRLRERRPGHELEVRVRRGGDVLAVPVTLAEKPSG
jgi:putative serine protease PepD